MPKCSETYGPGWTGDIESGNCQYSPTTGGPGQEGTGNYRREDGQWVEYDKYSGDFTGTVGSLGFGDEFKGTSIYGSEGGWGQYFDQYDPTKEKRLEKQAGIDIGQLQSGWELESGQLGETWAESKAELERQREGAGTLWGLKQADLERKSAEAGSLWDIQRGELERGKTEAQTLWGLQEAGAKETFGLQRGEIGAQAGAGMRQAARAGTAARRKSGLATSGTAAGMERRARGDVIGQYGRGMRGAESKLGQTLAMGEERLSQTLAGLTGQIDIGAETLAQTQAGYGASIEIGQEGLAQTQGLLDYQTTAGQTAYDQAMATGAYDLTQGIVDVGQGLETGTWALRDAWEASQESQKLDILSDPGIYPEGTTRYG